MEIATITKAVCEIARTFEEKGNVSVITLFEESGYLEDPNQITEEQILEYLRHNPDLIDTWVLHSENQRTSQGWYIKSPVGNDSPSDIWIVGWYPGGEINKFRDGASAVAFYVKREAEAIRGIIEKTR
jgi:hypothetical protein